MHPCVSSASMCAGEPLDVMKRAILTAGTQELAQKLVPFTQKLQFPDSRR